MKINWDVNQQLPRNAKQQQQPQQQQNQQKKYNQTLVDAEEVSIMIDQTLGIEAIIPPNKTTPLNLSKSSNRMNSNSISPQNSLSTPIYSPTKLTDMICIKVFHVFSIPTDIPIIEMNPYVLFDWESLGKASTHSLQQTFTPTFNSTLKFRSPLPHGSSLQDTLLHSPPLLIQLYSKQNPQQLQQLQQEKRFDRLIASKLINDVSLFDFKGNTVKIKLIKNGTKNILGGIIEFEIVLV